MKYDLNKNKITYQVEGKRIIGNETVLLHEAIDLTHGKNWSADGFTVQKFLEDESFFKFKQKTRELLISLWKESGLLINSDFELDQYHAQANRKELHLAAVEKSKLLHVSVFPLAIEIIEQRISEICGVSLIAKNPFDNQSVFHFRVIRPNSNDNNPLHRDVWLEDYANCINLYIPIAGSNSNSSLAIIPGSHYWPENKIERTEGGAEVSGTKFNVPAVTSINENFKIIRPDPKENEVLIFSPYLIHGGSVNLNPDQTRISIELRLWKKS